LPVGLGRLSTAEVAQRPGRVAQHAQLAAVAQQGQQRAQGAGLEYKVAACGAVTGDVTQGPDGLLPHVGLVAAEQLDKDGHGACLDDDLCLLRGPGGDVGKGPCRLELHQRVRGAEELDEAAHDARLDNALDGRVALLGEELAEFGRRLDLLIDLFREDALDHLGEFFVELARGQPGALQERRLAGGAMVG
jgi:hypothetical protein